MLVMNLALKAFSTANVCKEESCYRYEHVELTLKHSSYFLGWTDMNRNVTQLRVYFSPTAKAFVSKVSVRTPH